MNSYVVTAYRWGQRNAHSYVVGAFPELQAAKDCADAYVDYRGGKYAAEVTEAGPWEEHGEVAKQVYYVESPYYGLAGDAGHFHPADVRKNARPAPKPFTVRELQNRVGELEREALRLRKDEARLDWLESHPLKSEIHGGSEDGHTGKFWGVGAHSGTLRDAVDVIRAAVTN